MIFACTDFRAHEIVFRMLKKVTVCAHLRCFILYNVLIDMFWHQLTQLISDKDVLNAKDLVSLTEHQKVDIKITRDRHS